MRCEKCGNDYPSQYYFSTPTICTDCFNAMSPEEQQANAQLAGFFNQSMQLSARIGFGYRLAAALIDTVIVYILLIIALFVSGSMTDFMAASSEIFTNPTLFSELMLKIAPIALLLSALYYSMEVILGATPGKMLFNLQIADDNGVKSSYMKLFYRFSIKNISIYFSFISLITSISIFGTISSVLSIIILIGFFFVLGQKRMAIHDMIAKTAVYKKDFIKESV